MIKDKKICFIGAGNMAQALIKGLLGTKFPAQNITVTAKTIASLDKIRQIEKSLHVTTNNLQAVNNADIIVLAVKPNDIENICYEIRSEIRNTNPLVISVAGGVRHQFLQNILGRNIDVVRAMPNTPTMICQGITGLYATKDINNSYKQLVENLMNLVGITIWISDEKDMHALTAISGCSPAYIFLMIDIMQHNAVLLGFSKKQAKKLVTHTIKGATNLCLASELSAQSLAKNVCSAGGITEQGVQALKNNGFLESVSAAIKKTYQCSFEMEDHNRKN